MINENAQDIYSELQESQGFFLEQQKISLFYQESLDNYPQISSQNNNLEEIKSELDNLHSFGQQEQRPKKPRKKRKKQFHYDKNRKRRQSKKQMSKIQIPNQFSQQEDKAILLYVLYFGPKFMKIAKFFPTKTISMVKNRYYKYLRYKWDSVLGESYAYLNQLDCFKKEENLILGKDETQSFRNLNMNEQFLCSSHKL